MATTTPTFEQRNFIRNIIDEDISLKKYTRIVTRFPPEPSGYLHLGHAKSILLNFNLARTYGGECHLRFDDTNPEKESIHFMKSIQEDVKWLLEESADSNVIEQTTRYTSEYFGFLHSIAEHLIRTGNAYIDHSSSQEIAQSKGTLTEVGTDSPYRSRAIEESLKDFSKMARGEYSSNQLQAPVLRLKIDMTSPNLVMRDPVIYRVCAHEHPITGNSWKIYPMYDFAHPIADALEGISHSLCTMEFSDHRPLYEWILSKLKELLPLMTKSDDQSSNDFFNKEMNRVMIHQLQNSSNECLPTQIEFSRLNIEHHVLSKRVLSKLIQNSSSSSSNSSSSSKVATSLTVEKWDDPRLLTIRGLREKGVPAAAIRLFIDIIGVSKSESTLKHSVLDSCIREVLQTKSPRMFAVLDPLKVTVSNWPEDKVEEVCRAPLFPPSILSTTGLVEEEAAIGYRNLTFGRYLYIDRSDFREASDGNFFGLVMGGKVRLKYAYEVACDKVVKDDHGNIVELVVTYDPNSRQKTKTKVKGKIQWLNMAFCQKAYVNIYAGDGALFQSKEPEKENCFELNPLSHQPLRSCMVEEDCSKHLTGSQGWVQFERLGYFKHVNSSHALTSGDLTEMDAPLEMDKAPYVFNRVTSLRHHQQF